MTEVRLYLKKLEVEAVGEVEEEVVVEVEGLEVVQGRRPWVDCSAEECLNYDQLETVL